MQILAIITTKKRNLSELQLDAIKTVLENVYKVIGYNADNEPVFLPHLSRLGTSESQQITGNWLCFAVRASGSLGPIKNAVASSDPAIYGQHASLLLSGSPQSPMRFVATPDKSYPLFSEVLSSQSWADEHIDFDLAAAGLSKSDNVFLFFKARHSANQQVLAKIKVFKRSF